MPPSPGHRRSRTIVASPLSSGRRRSSHRLSITCISKPAKSSNVKVCIRVRPSNEKEQTFRDGKEVIEIMDERSLVFDPVEVHTPSFHRGRPTRDPTAKRHRDLKFGFGRVFGPYATNQEVFEETTQETLDNLMKGINCSVFAYGATGAGKTFTMLGTATNKGVIARTVHALYERIEAIRESTICEVEVSYLEIYNETVRDLLRPHGKELILREGSNGVVVSGLSFHKPANVDELFQMLEEGNSNRTQHPTDANKESSRSHAVFHIYLKQKDRTADMSTDVVMSKMALIDLAGSERAAATANCGARFREGANINKSLLALGNCINALAEGKKTIAFRDSKLTRILKDSLGGNCQTVMIAAVSSSVMAYDDTYNTLKYADRAQKIKLDLKQNVYRVDHSAYQYGKIVEQLQTEIQEMRHKIEMLELDKRRLRKELDSSRQNAYVADMALEAATKPSSTGVLNEKQLNDLKDVIGWYTQTQCSLLEAESQRSLIQLKLLQRERSQQQLQDVQWDSEKKNLVQTRWDKFRASSQGRLDNLASQVSHFEDGLRDMKRCVDDVFGSMSATQENGHVGNGDGAMDPAMELNKMLIEAMKDKSDVCQLKASDRHLRSVVDCLNARMDHQDRIIETMGSLLKEQHLLLQSYDYLTPSFVARFESVEKMLEGAKEVSWSDQNGNAVATTSKILELPDCTIRKFGLRTTSFTVQNSINGHSALIANGTANSAVHAPTFGHSILHNGPSRSVDVRFEDLPRPHLRPATLAEAKVEKRSQPVLSSSDDEQPIQQRLPATPPKSFRLPSLPAKSKGTPFRLISSSSDDGEESSDGEHTFTMDENPKNGQAAGGVKSDVVTGRMEPPGGCKDSRPRFGGPSVVPKFTIGIPEVGRPSLPASKAPPRVPPRVHDVDADGFKKPPVPERFAGRPKMEKPNEGVAGATKPKGAVENGGLIRKPSVTSIRNSPLIRSPSQNSLNKREKTPDMPMTNTNGAGGSGGLRRQAASMKNLREGWRY